MAWTTISFAQSPPPPIEGGERFRPDRILVRFKDDLNTQTQTALHRRHKAKVLRRFKSLGNVDVVGLPPEAVVQVVLRQYESSGLVERAEPDYWLRATATPNDPRFVDGTLWNLRNTGQSSGLPGADIGAVAAWDTLNFANNVVVAVIDSGVRYTHQDLAANMWVNPGESGQDFLGRDKRTNGIDDDGNGIVDDVHGLDAINNTGNPIDPDGHGTHVAGTIGAVGNNRTGVVGVAWGVQIMACRFLANSGFGSTSDAIQCIDYARNKGATIINASWGDTSYSSFLESAVRRTRDSGIVFVAAAGNEGADNDRYPFYPAGFNLDNIVSVAATTRTDALASFSDFGANSVDLAAPGASIYSTFNLSDSSYTYLSGTSMAAPHVAGAFALLRTLKPAETYKQLINRVLATADPLPSLSGRCVTGGRLNVQRALTANLVADFIATPVAGSPPMSVQFRNASVGENLRLQWDFGDGSAKSEEQNPTHLFTGEGKFAVNLTVTDPSGKSNRKTRTISAVANYEIRTPTFSWLDPFGMAQLNLSDNGVSSAQTLPFSFNFYGQNYERIYVGANGVIGFGNQGLSTTLNSDLPSASQPNAVICPWWDDLYPSSGGQVRIGTVGTAPNRQTVVSWVNVPHRQSTSYAFTFQVVLNEGSNEILFQYLQVQATRTRGAGKSATIGLENETGQVAKKYSLDGSALLRNNQAILFVPSSSGGIAVSPSLALTASGPVGGPFSPSSQTYTIRNTSRSSVNWTVRKNQGWITLSATGGTLAAGQSASVAATINVSAQELRAGSYLDTLEFLNLNNGNGNTTRVVSLAVNGTNGVLEITPPTSLSSSGFVGGPFNPASQIYTVINTGDATVEWKADCPAEWVSVAPVSGTLAAGDSITVTASVTGIANELSDGTYTNLIAFTNLTNDKGSARRSAMLTVISPTASLSISPPGPLQFTGFSDGLVSPATVEVTLTNPSDASLEWTVTTTQPWLKVSTTSGRIAAGQSIPLIISVDVAAAQLLSGAQQGHLIFASTGGGARVSLEAILIIAQRATLTASVAGTENPALRMRVIGEPGQTYVVETSIELRQWIPVATNIISPNGFFEFTDLNTGSSPQRYYRAVLSP